MLQPFPLAVTFGLICGLDPFRPFFGSGVSLVLGCAAGGYVVNYLLNKNEKTDIFGIDVSGVMKDVNAVQGGMEGALVGLFANFGSQPLYRSAIGFMGPFVYDKLL